MKLSAVLGATLLSFVSTVSADPGTVDHEQARLEVSLNAGRIRIGSLPGSGSLDKRLRPDNRSAVYGLETTARLTDRFGISLGARRADDLHWFEAPACPAEGPCEISHVSRRPIHTRGSSAGIFFDVFQYEQFVALIAARQVRSVLEIHLSDTASDAIRIRYKGMELGLGARWQTESGWFMGVEWATADLKAQSVKQRQTGFEAQIGFRF